MSVSTAGADGRRADSSGAGAVVAALREHDHFVMCAHEKPDGDVVGSGFALGLVLKAMGKSVRYFLDDEMPRNLRFLPDADQTQRTFDGVDPKALFIFMD